MTEWRAVPGFEGLYEVSSEGNVRSLDRKVRAVGGAGYDYLRTIKGRVLKPSIRKGQTLVSLYPSNTSSKPVPILTHRVVATAFIPNPEGLPLVRHLNGDFMDNRVENLAWGTQSDNIQDAIQHGTHFNASKTHCKNGHEFTEENTILDKFGYRHCRTCNNESQRRRRGKG